MSDITDRDNLDLETSPGLNVDILSLHTGEADKYLQNYEAVQRLEQESDLLAKIALGSVGISTALGIFSVINPALPIINAGLMNLFIRHEYIWRVRRLYVVAKSILDHYGDDNVVLTPRIKTDKATIDLLVRMPDRKLYALMIRANEDRVVTWNGERQEFNVRKKGKKPKRSDPLTRAIESLQTIVDFRKTRHPIMGVSAADRNAPLIKAIVLAPGARVSAPEDSTLWHDWNGLRVLKIQTVSVTYVVECKDLINFLQPVQKNGASAPQ